jgi:hypothetical protein
MSNQTVHINPRFKVEIDKWNHTLLEFIPEKIIKKGKHAGEISKEKWLVVGYYSNMSGVLKKLSACAALDDANCSMIEHCKAILEEAENLCESVLLIGESDEVD